MKTFSNNTKGLDCSLLVVMALRRIVQILTRLMSTWDNPNTSPNPTTATNPLAVLAEVAQSHSQSSLPNVIGEQKWWKMVELNAHLKMMRKCHYWKMQTAQNCEVIEKN